MMTLVSFVFALGTAYAAGPYQLTFKNVRAEVILATDPPPAGRMTAMTLQFKDGQGQERDPQAQPKVALFMKMGHHQHGSEPTSVRAVPGTKGRFEVTNVNFYMPGVWRVEVTLERGGGNDEKQEFTVTTGGGGSRHQH